MKRKEVAIIGAGPMGLAAAYQLALDGHKPIVFEADDRAGGMAATFNFHGSQIERYYHFHCTSDTAFFKVLDELGLNSKLRWVKTRMGYWYNNSLQSWGNPVALLMFRGLSLTAKFRYGLHAFVSVKRNNWELMEKHDAVTWIKNWVGEEAYVKLWEKLLKLKFYEYTEHLSAPWIWSRIRRIGRSRYNLFHEKLGYLEGGSEVLIRSMQEKIESLGGEFHFSRPVTEINVKNGQVISIKVKGRSLKFDHVISTISLPQFGEIIQGLDPELHSKFTEKHNIAVVCVIVKLKRNLTENFWTNTNDDEMDIPGIIEYTNLNPAHGHIVYVPYYIPREHPKYSDPDKVFRQKITHYFKKINPEMTDDDFIDIRVHRYPYAQPICGPRYLSTLAPVETAKGLFAADTSYYYPEDRGISESIDYGRKIARMLQL
jgi:protoporphyrinogen oxidase